MSDDEFKQMLAAVSAEFRADLPARMAGIDELWRQIIDGGYAPQRMDDLIRAVHKIAGSAETFGLTAVGQAAAAAESCLESCRGIPQAPEAAVEAEITRLLDMLRDAAGIGRR